MRKPSIMPYNFDTRSHIDRFGIQGTEVLITILPQSALYFRNAGSKPSSRVLNEECSMFVVLIDREDYR